MKRVIAVIVVLQIIGFFERSLLAQGTLQGSLYLYSMDRLSPPVSTLPIGSDSWGAQGFSTGANTDGYVLNSIILPPVTSLMGNPSNLVVSLYGFNASSGGPGNSLFTLANALTPPENNYDYTSISGAGVILLPNTVYFIVLTAETPVSVGAFGWGVANQGAQSSDGWAFYARYYDSQNGLSWQNNTSANYFRMGMYATAVPEPAAGILFGLCLVGLARRQWQRQ